MFVNINAQLTDINGQSYKTVVIGSQTWMAENLNVDRFRNGDLIPEAKTDEEWRLAGENKQPAWCYLNNDPSNAQKYGKLYNWYAATDSRGIAPIGWHTPLNRDIEIIIQFCQESTLSCLKSNDGWEDIPEEIGHKEINSNSSGFSAVPSGERTVQLGFGAEGFGCNFWSSNEFNLTLAWSLALFNEEVPKEISLGFTKKSDGYSIRCIKD
jgi:uncharacterized protein (TIGR02145 family)